MMRVSLVLFIILTGMLHAAAVELSVGVFHVDATPPAGSPLCGASVPPMRGVDDPLSARGIVLKPTGEDPVVLCAVDWVGISNGGHDAWRKAIAETCGTTMDRVMVHTLHQHDAPFCDFAVEALMAEHDMPGRMFDADHARETIASVSEAAADALKKAQRVTHIGWGEAEVEKVASNRRILGEDGKVRVTRYTACRDPEVRAEPAGTIDPMLKTIVFWNADEQIAVLSYYATHPQSFYRTGMVSVDFPGIARNTREEATGIPHIHFNGAGGNIGAGKYNDGSPENRPVLAKRVEDGLANAYANANKTAASDLDWDWTMKTVELPVRDSAVSIEGERERLADTSIPEGQRMRAARELAWMASPTIDFGRLKIGPIQIIHMPGELFVEYQLAAQEMAPDSFVCMAAYGDYGPGYIGTAIAYTQGGYEAQVYTSRTDPEVEDVLMNTMESLLALE